MAGQVEHCGGDGNDCRRIGGGQSGSRSGWSFTVGWQWRRCCLGWWCSQGGGGDGGVGGGGGVTCKLWRETYSNIVRNWTLVGGRLDRGREDVIGSEVKIEVGRGGRQQHWVWGG